MKDRPEARPPRQEQKPAARREGDRAADRARARDGEAGARGSGLAERGPAAPDGGAGALHARARSIDAGPRQAAQRRRIERVTGEPVQRVAGGGLPAGLRQGVEALSGEDLSDVRVHRGSSRPASVGALAYAQGSEIHLAPGQERHLPHEAWHVVQQRQGRVPATGTVAGMPLNDDPALEREAERMGSRASSG